MKLVAHRGYQRQFPENTLLAYVEAIKEGALFIETDVQLSADQIPVLYHDRTLERSSGAKGAIHEYSYDQLLHTPNHEPLRFGNQFLSQTISPLTDLATLLQTHPKVHAFIEAKSVSIDFHGIETCYKQISETLKPVAQQCTIISFHLPFISYARNNNWHSVGIAPRKWQDLSSENIGIIQPDFIFIDVDILPEEGRLDTFSGEMVVYEVDNPEVVRSLQQRGINYIETFDIVGLQKALEEDEPNEIVETS